MDPNVETHALILPSNFGFFFFLLVLGGIQTITMTYVYKSTYTIFVSNNNEEKFHATFFFYSILIRNEHTFSQSLALATRSFSISFWIQYIAFEVNLFCVLYFGLLVETNRMESSTHTFQQSLEVILKHFHNSCHQLTMARTLVIWFKINYLYYSIYKAVVDCTSNAQNWNQIVSSIRSYRKSADLCTIKRLLLFQ